jgi:hypothetical protein
MGRQVREWLATKRSETTPDGMNARDALWLCGDRLFTRAQ